MRQAVTIVVQKASQSESFFDFFGFFSLVFDGF